jgi:membrane protease YdiL (CAAX protease family)
MEILKENDLTAEGKQHSLSILLFFMLILSLLLVYTGHLWQYAYNHGADTALSCIGIGIVCAMSITAMVLMKMPYRCFGFYRCSTKSLIETIIISLLFCVLALAAKYYLITHIPSLEKYPLLIIQHGTAAATPKTLWLYFILYSLFAPVQSYIYHGVIEGPMIDLTNTRYKAFLVICLSTLFFTAVHFAFFGLEFAAVVLLPGLVWCMLYYRYRSLLTISVSHIIIGGILLLLVGAKPFLLLLTSFFS